MPIVHVEPPVKFQDYKKLFRFHTIYTLEYLKEVLEGKLIFGFDTETNQLNTEEGGGGFIVGFSFSTNGIDGYYIPIAHKNDQNAPRECLEYVALKIKEAKIVLMYNKAFDINMMVQAEGLDIGNHLNIQDVMGLIWLRDTDYKMPSLKWASQHFLGIIQPVYLDAVGETTFDYVLVKDITEYACLDAIVLLHLVTITYEKYPNLKRIFQLDNLAIEAVRAVVAVPNRIDGKYLRSEEERVLQELVDSRRKIFDYLGYEVNPDSNRDKGNALLSSGAILHEKTKGGAWKVTQEVLEKVDHPLAKLFANHSKLQKYYGTYIKALLDMSEEGKKKLRFNYHLFNVPTGRFSSGADIKNPYYAKFNIQSVTKSREEPGFVIPDSKSVTGWSAVNEVDVPYGTSHYLVERLSEFRGVRAAFLPDDDESSFVSIDYKAEELRIAAILSGETTWLDAFKTGKDLHMLTAQSIFGEDADGNDRKKAKIANFSLIYGSTAYSFAQKFGLPIEEAERFVDDYFRALPGLQRWIKFIQRKGSKEDLYTYMGRPRRMSRYFYKEADHKTRAFGRRTAVNTVVQGLAGDIIRLVFAKLHLFLMKNLTFSPHFRVLSTVHDEVNFSVKNYWLDDFMHYVPKLMTIKFDEWPIALTVDTSVGPNWRDVIHYSYDEEKKLWTPIGEFVPR